MKAAKAKPFTEQETLEVWRRWKQGESLAQIGRQLHRAPPSIYSVLARHGGVKYTQRQRSTRTLSLAEREEISRGLAIGQSIRQIAAQLQRSPSTISREVKRNGSRCSYRAATADKAAWDRAKRPKLGKLAKQPKLKQLVETKLKRYRSPQQIACWLKREYAAEEHLWVSHETINKSLFIQARGTFKKELVKYLRTKPRLRRARVSKGNKRGQIPDLISISERPACVEDRAVPGHWEGDLIEGSNQSYIATLVERHTRFVCLIKVNSKHTEEVVNKLIAHAKTLPESVYKTLTWDRGAEMKQHKRFTLATDIDVYFCDPKSPWQRGSNENTNGLLRQFFPKGTDLSVHSQAKLDEVAHLMNGRPRQTLDFETPADRFMQCVAMTG